MAVPSPSLTLAQQRDQAPTQQNGASATNPSTGATIATVTVPTAANWEITVYPYFSGTVVAGDANNMAIFQNASNRFVLPLPAVAQTSQPVLPFIIILSCAAGDVIAIKTIGASGVSAVYNAAVTARQVS